MSVKSYRYLRRGLKFSFQELYTLRTGSADAFVRKEFCTVCYQLLNKVSN